VRRELGPQEPVSPDKKKTGSTGRGERSTKGARKERGTRGRGTRREARAPPRPPHQAQGKWGTEGRVGKRGGGRYKRNDQKVPGEPGRYGGTAHLNLSLKINIGPVGGGLEGARLSLSFKMRRKKRAPRKGSGNDRIVVSKRRRGKNP